MLYYQPVCINDPFCLPVLKIANGSDGVVNDGHIAVEPRDCRYRLLSYRAWSEYPQPAGPAKNKALTISLSRKIFS